MKASVRLGSRIAELRKSKKLTQAELAKNIGVTRAAISQFEQGSSTPSFQNLLKISEILGLDLTGLLPRIGRFPILSAEENEEVAIIIGNDYNRLVWDYLRRNESDLPDPNEEAKHALSGTSYAFESLSLPQSLLPKGRHIAFPVPGHAMEPSFGEGDLLLLTLQPQPDWSAFPLNSRHFDDIDTFPMCVVEYRSERESGLEFGRFGINESRQRLTCYFDDRNHSPRNIKTADVKAVWEFRWCLSKRPQNPAQQLVYQVDSLEHEVHKLKAELTQAQTDLTQANAVIGNLLSQLPKTEPVQDK